MKFPRDAKILRSHFDVAPFAAVFFLLLMFLMLSGLLPTPGIPLAPPTADQLPGPDKPTVAMAVDANENLYYDNSIVTEGVLINYLMVANRTTRTPLTLIIHADKNVSYGTLAHLSLVARRCGITNCWLATMPGIEPAAKP
jgi:biopolymer transport protein ExbD